MRPSTSTLRPSSSYKGAGYKASTPQATAGGISAAPLTVSMAKAQTQSLWAQFSKNLTDQTVVSEVLKQSKELNDKTANLDGDFFVPIQPILLQALNLETNSESHFNSLLTQLMKSFSELTPATNRFKANLGYYYMQNGQHTAAIKAYRQALDAVPVQFSEERAKIMRSIANIFFCLHLFTDAAEMFERVQKSVAFDTTTALNLITCYFYLKDQPKLKNAFQKLLAVQLPTDPDDPELNLLAVSNGTYVLPSEADDLKKFVHRKIKEHIDGILHAVSTIAPAIETDANSGFTWIVQTLKQSQLPGLTAEVLLLQAGVSIREKDFDTALAQLQNSNHPEKNTNTSFLYCAVRDFEQAEKAADMALRTKESPAALVNRANAAMGKARFDEAKRFYEKALAIDSHHLIALYNYGLCLKALELWESSKDAFEKLNKFQQDKNETDADVLFHLAELYLQLGETDKSMDLYNVLATSKNLKRTTDPVIANRLAMIYEAAEDHAQALHYYLESFNLLPTDLSVIAWIAVHYVNHDMLEKAVHFFERASEVDPKDPKWRLMVGSCLKKMGNYQRALEIFQQVHDEYPYEIDCLRSLVELTQQIGHETYVQYAGELARLERDIGEQDEHDAHVSPKPFTEAAEIQGGDPLSPSWANIPMPDLGI